MNKMRKLLVLLLSFAVSFTLFASPVLAAEADEGPQTAEDTVSGISGYTETAPEELPDSNTLLQGYIDRAFFGDGFGTVSLQGEDAGNNLTGFSRNLYQLLKAKIKETASSTKDVSTVFTFSLEDLNLDGTWTAKDLGLEAFTDINVAYEALLNKTGATLEAMDKVIKAVLADCPYDLYWFDKTGSGGAQSSIPGATLVSPNYDKIRFTEDFAIKMTVAEAYRASASAAYKKSGAATSSIATAVNNAKKIVSDNKNKSDLEKLNVYFSSIKDLTDYHPTAMTDEEMPYGNPWQLIWVFDGDPETKVVCEGYSKAFQYLCDLSTFRFGVKSRIVSGTMSGGTGAGSHMWNVVTMDDSGNYLVDITNCDGTSVGVPDKLFLVGSPDSSMNVNAGYTFPLDPVVSYEYDDQTRMLYKDSELALKNIKKYTTECAHSLKKVPAVSYCEKEGVKEHWKCTKCNRKYADQNGKTQIAPDSVVTAPAGHKWGTPAWTWKADYTASAKFTCSRCSKTKTVKASVTSKVTKQPTTTATGSRVYTATAQLSGKNYTDKKTEVLAKKAKAKQPMTVKAKTKSVKYAKVKKKKVTVSGAIVVKNAQGKVTYKKISKGSSKNLSVNKKTGKITVKKKTKKGKTYKIKVKVTAAGNSDYEKGSKTVTVKIKVK